MKETLSIRLFQSLLKGKKQLSHEAFERISHFVRSQRMDNGAFRNKSGQPDLYYTVFGQMLSYVLNIPSDSEKNSRYLESLNPERLDLIHYAAYMRCRMIRQLIDQGKISLWIHSLFATEIKPLADFNGLPHNDRQSPYTQFIWLSLLEDTGNRIKDPKEMLHSLEAYRAPTGGYMNTTDGLTATTNATAAALAIKGQLEGYRENPDIDSLRKRQAPSGGFAAAEASPLPDLLSTATALFILNCYKSKPRYAAKEFIEAHWLESGGFSATLLEDKSDVEYTFYGLLALGAIDV
ncbi:hypothetical protein M2480_000507 [Parabacteroides sp. PFB2-12]|nr:hypothetical protein [Parabacteroides sp. PM6-13]MDH6389547.1 hypothetical protein [Parabacteroides sp. PFB2-12]